MTESLIGRSVRLTGHLWDRNVFYPDRGTVHIINRKNNGFWIAGEAMSVLTLDGHPIAGWEVELLPQPGALEVRPYAIGFLDGLLGLEAQQGDDEYLMGLARGEEMKEAMDV